MAESPHSNEINERPCFWQKTRSWDHESFDGVCVFFVVSMLNVKIETKSQHTVCFVFQLFEWKGIKISTKLILSYILGFCGFSIRLFFFVRLCSSFGCTDSATNAAAATGQTQKQRHQDPKDDKGDKCHHERSIGAVVG